MSEDEEREWKLESDNKRNCRHGQSRHLGTHWERCDIYLVTYTHE